MATKIERAVEIFKNNQRKMTNIEIVNKIIKDLKMTTAGARTYAYNARKILASKKRVRPTKKATASVRTAASLKKSTTASSGRNTPALDTIVKAKKLSPAARKHQQRVARHVVKEPDSDVIAKNSTAVDNNV